MSSQQWRRPRKRSYSSSSSSSDDQQFRHLGIRRRLLESSGDETLSACRSAGQQDQSPMDIDERSTSSLPSDCMVIDLTQDDEEPLVPGKYLNGNQSHGGPTTNSRLGTHA